MWNVSLTDMTYYQTCHDPECRMLGFRGEVKMLPDDVQHEIKHIFSENDFQVDDEFEAALASLDIPQAAKRVDSDADDASFEAKLSEALLSNPNLFP